jgi:FKBP-type peptidyl-prolyl cis-trans isomerase FklB
MKKSSSIIVISVLSILIISSCGPEKKYSLTKVKTRDDSASYFIGMNFGSQLKQSNIDSIFNYNAFMKGVTDAVYKDSMPVSQMEMQMFLNKYFSEMQEKQMKKQFKDYIEQNKTFLAANAKKDSVITLPSGLQYKVLVQGTGIKPAITDKVKVHYIGTLIDGQVFDSSYDRKEPYEFVVGQVIPGWVEILQLMPVGSKYRVFIPENLAYGSQARGEVIKPFSTLIFDMELVEVVAPTK